MEKIDTNYYRTVANTEHSIDILKAEMLDFANEVDALLSDVRALLEAAKDCIDSLKYVDKIYPDKLISGYGVRFDRICKAKKAIAAIERHWEGKTSGSEKTS